MRNVLLIVHLIAIAMGVGMSISNQVNLRISAQESGERRAGLALLRRELARIADIVIAVIWLTGLGLWGLVYSFGIPNHWFLAKLGFVLLLTIGFGLVRMTAGRMARTGDESLMPRLQLFVSGVWISALLAIVFAVLAFEI